VCFPPAGVVSFSFSTTFGTWPADDAFATGDGTFGAVDHDRRRRQRRSSRTTTAMSAS
jgi:hypothetical protein